MSSLKGVQQAITQLRNLQRRSQAAMRRGERRIARIIVEEAKAKAPGTLANDITFIQDETSTTIIGGYDLAAYREFGTGDFAAMYLAGKSDEQRTEALKFFVNGLGRNPARPFFFPAVYNNRDKIITFVEEELQKLQDD